MLNMYVHITRVTTARDLEELYILGPRADAAHFGAHFISYTLARRQSISLFLLSHFYIAT